MASKSGRRRRRRELERTAERTEGMTRAPAAVPAPLPADPPREGPPESAAAPPAPPAVPDPPAAAPPAEPRTALPSPERGRSGGFGGAMPETRPASAPLPAIVDRSAEIDRIARLVDGLAADVRRAELKLDLYADEVLRHGQRLASALALAAPRYPAGRSGRVPALLVMAILSIVPLAWCLFRLLGVL